MSSALFTLFPKAYFHMLVAMYICFSRYMAYKRNQFGRIDQAPSANGQNEIGIHFLRVKRDFQDFAEKGMWLHAYSDACDLALQGLLEIFECCSLFGQRRRSNDVDSGCFECLTYVFTACFREWEAISDERSILESESWSICLHFCNRQQCMLQKVLSFL